MDPVPAVWEDGALPIPPPLPPPANTPPKKKRWRLPLIILGVIVGGVLAEQHFFCN